MLATKIPCLQHAHGLAVALAAVVALGAAPCLAQARPPFPSAVLDGIAPLVDAALREGKLPGCVVVVGRGTGVLYQRAFGARSLVPAREPMSLDTVFDLASLTKPVATAASIMKLVEEGKVDLDQPVAHYLPAFARAGKSAITLRQLLTHVSGLPADTAVADYEHGRAYALERIAAVALKAAPGSRLIYSDLGYIVLEEVIRQVTGQDLASFAARAIFRPLGMTDTGFSPSPALQARSAPTEMRDGRWMRGQVHDPRAFRLGGVAGHAGLFSTAADLALFSRMILGGGQVDGKRVLSARTVAQMLAAHDVPGGIRALGWDMQSAYSINRGSSLSRRAVGHGGYTGTSLWIDPAQDVFVLFLSNRVHPDGKGQVNTLAAAIATLVGDALAGPFAPSGDGPLRLGIDVLGEQGFALLRGLRIALLTNDSARTGAGQRTTDVLAGRSDLRLVALLSPEHGLSATHEAAIADGVDARTGVPIHSLYGGSMAPRAGKPTGPRPVSLPPAIDAVVVDLPDVGARFFTYASTLHATMRAAAERGLRLILLDRPNPLGGTRVAGPMLEPGEHSPVNHHPLPIVHGMTLGELAEMMNADEHLGLRLEVVCMQGYRAAASFADTGLAWYPPSPNLRSPQEALLYPGVALVEGTNVSVGRGTDTPFEVVGAPWIVAGTLAQALAKERLAGVSFAATSFTPTAAPYAGKRCQGVRVRLDDAAAFEPARTGIAVALALRKHFRRQWEVERLHAMIGDPAVTAAILAGKDLRAIESLYSDDLDAFRAKRAKYLLYPR